MRHAGSQHGVQSVIEGVRRQAGAIEIHPGITIDLKIEKARTMHLQRPDTREFRVVGVVARWLIAALIMMPRRWE
jgi:hypothetical protein